MTNTEQLVEAVTYASEDGINWYEIFDSKTEALKAIKSAIRETPDEGQIVCLLSAREADNKMFEYSTADKAYKDELRVMKQEVLDNM